MHGRDEDKLESSRTRWQTRKDEDTGIGDLSRSTQKQSSSVRQVVGRA